MIRPELQEHLWKWRDVLAGLALAVFGAWWVTVASGATSFLGYAGIALGVVLMIGGWQRVRFHAAGQGPGVVKVVERRLAYFGPLTGGAMEMDDVVRLDLVNQALPAHWRLTSGTGELLDIPVNADGSDLLFDLFSSLPGIDVGRLLRALNESHQSNIVVWQRTGPPQIS